jgi:predicted MPP superfamily phosphohydrolase
MFGTAFTIAFSALLAYVLWRAASVPALSRRLSRRGFVLLGAGLAAVFFLGRALGHDGTGRAAAALEWAGMSLLGAVLLVSVALLAVDLVTAFGFLFSRWAPSLRGWAIVAGGLLSAIALVQGHRGPEVVAYEVTLPSLPPELDGRVAVAFSDTHLGASVGASWFADRVAQLEALRPDLVLFLGDIFEGHGEVPRELPGLGSLSAPLGKWYVTGNHEGHRAGNGNELLERAGFRRLANRWAEVAPGLVVAGVDDLTNHWRRRLPGDPLGEALAGLPRAATIFLSHTPRQAERVARAGVELMLSGHTHGGQLWPFSLLTGRIYPLLAGRYDVEGMPVIVCRGTGTWGPRMRLWRRGEILKVTLRAPLRHADVRQAG